MIYLNNKLIAEFMGLNTEFFCEICKSGIISYPEIHRNTCRCGRLGYNIEENDFTELVKNSKYHKSWDWLMPVVDKVFNITFSDDNKETFDSEYFYKIRDCIPNLNHTYKGIIDFIKLYNKRL